LIWSHNYGWKTLFYYKRLGDREAKRLCGGEIDDKIELAGQFDRDLLGLDAL